MFRLDNLLERWAELYTPLSHTKDGRKSFFRIGMIDANSYFVRNFNTCPPSCMAYATRRCGDQQAEPEAALLPPRGLFPASSPQAPCRRRRLPTRRAPPRPASPPTIWCRTSLPCSML